MHKNRVSIRINDAEKIDKPYYNISIIRQKKEYVEFYLLVMKSKTNKTEEHKQIVESFKRIKAYGYSQNYVGQYESKPNPKWSEETLNYFNKIQDPETFEFGFFTHSLVDDEDQANRELVRGRVLYENRRLYNLNEYNLWLLICRFCAFYICQKMYFHCYCKRVRAL